MLNNSTNPKLPENNPNELDTNKWHQTQRTDRMTPKMTWNKEYERANNGNRTRLTRTKQEHNPDYFFFFFSHELTQTKTNKRIDKPNVEDWLWYQLIWTSVDLLRDPISELAQRRIVYDFRNGKVDWMTPRTDATGRLMSRYRTLTRTALWKKRIVLNEPKRE